MYSVFDNDTSDSSSGSENDSDDTSGFNHDQDYSNNSDSIRHLPTERRAVLENLRRSSQPLSGPVAGARRSLYAAVQATPDTGAGAGVGAGIGRKNDNISGGGHSAQKKPMDAAMRFRQQQYQIGSGLLILQDDDPEVGIAESLQAGMIHPKSRGLFYFNTFMALLVMTQVLSVPFRAAFGTDTPLAWFAIDLVTDIMYVVDIIVHIRTAIYVDGSLVQDRKFIVQNYYRHHFMVLDVLASLPFNILQLAFGRWMPITRINKTLRARRLLHMFSVAENDPNHSFALLRLCKLVCYVLTIAHYAACGWFSFGASFGFGSTDWVPSIALSQDSRGSQYIRSFYFALGTMAGVGTDPNLSGDIPVREIESIFSITVMLAGVLTFAYIIGSMQSVVQATNFNLRYYNRTMSEIMRFLDVYQVSRSLRDKVWSYYSYLWERQSGFDASHPFMHKITALPDALRLDMAEDMPLRCLQDAPFFQGLEEGFLAALTLRLIFRVAVPREYIVRLGEPGNSIFFIHQGSAEVLVGKEKTSVAQVNQGQSLGEYSLLLGQNRTAYVRAITFCDMYVLYRKELVAVSRVYPRSASELLRRVIASRVKTKARENKIQNARRAESGASSHPASSPSVVNPAPQRLQQIPTMRKISIARVASSASTTMKPFRRTSTVRRRGVGANAAELRRKRSSVCSTLSPSQMLQLEQYVAPETPKHRPKWMKDLSEWTILPTSTFHNRWVALVILATLYNCVMVPFRAAFLLYNGTDSYTVTIALDIIADIIMLGDMFVNMRTAFVDQGFIVLDKQLLWQRYKQQWFKIDVIASFPIDFLLWPVVGIRSPYARFGRLLHLPKVYAQIGKKMYSSRYSQLIRLARLIFTLLVLSHYMGCVYITYTYFEGYASNSAISPWLPREDIRNKAPALKYWRSLQFSLSILTGAGKSVPAQTDNQMVLSLIGLLTGIFVVAYLISNVAAVLSNLDAAANQMNREKRFAVAFLDYHNVTPAVQTRVTNCFDQEWSVNKGIDPNTMLQRLPRRLRAQVMMQVTGDLFRQISMFEKAPRDLIEDLAWKLRFNVFPIGEFVCRQGYMGSHMFFILRGEVNLFVEVKDGSDTNELQRTHHGIDGSTPGLGPGMNSFGHEDSTSSIHPVSSDSDTSAFDAGVSTTANAFTAPVDQRLLNEFNLAGDVGGSGVQSSGATDADVDFSRDSDEHFLQTLRSMSTIHSDVQKPQPRASLLNAISPVRAQSIQQRHSYLSGSVFAAHGGAPAMTALQEEEESAGSTAEHGHESESDSGSGHNSENDIQQATEAGYTVTLPGVVRGSSTANPDDGNTNATATAAAAGESSDSESDEKHSDTNVDEWSLKKELDKATTSRRESTVKQNVVDNRFDWHAIRSDPIFDPDIGGMEHSMMIIGKGSFFGEGVFFTGKRSCSARTWSACTLLTLDRSAFHAVFSAHPKYYEKMQVTAYRRMINVGRYIRALQQSHASPKADASIGEHRARRRSTVLPSGAQVGVASHALPGASSFGAAGEVDRSETVVGIQSVPVEKDEDGNEIPVSEAHVLSYKRGSVRRSSTTHS
jgi:CRP-like cAMP-binding protein